MTGFTKLYNSILDSSIWDEDVYTRILWVTMLAAVGSNGQVIASKSRLRAKANIPEKQFDRALRILSDPDPESRTPDDEGRRIKQIQGGWSILNYQLYRKMRVEDDRKAYKREWDRKNRPSGAKRTKVRQSDSSPTNPTEAEAEAEAEEEEEEEKTSFRKEEKDSHSGFDSSPTAQAQAAMFAEELEKTIRPVTKSDRTAFLNLVIWASRHNDADEYYESILQLARASKTAKNPIGMLFYKLRQEVGYNPKAEAQKRK